MVADVAWIGAGPPIERALCPFGPLRLCTQCVRRGWRQHRADETAGSTAPKARRSAGDERTDQPKPGTGRPANHVAIQPLVDPRFGRFTLAVRTPGDRNGASLVRAAFHLRCVRAPISHFQRLPEHHLRPTGSKQIRPKPCASAPPRRPPARRSPAAPASRCARSEAIASGRASSPAPRYWPA
jgi:hypothetical protein